MVLRLPGESTVDSFEPVGASLLLWPPGVQGVGGPHDWGAHRGGQRSWRLSHHEDRGRGHVGGPFSLLSGQTAITSVPLSLAEAKGKLTQCQSSIPSRMNLCPHHPKSPSFQTCPTLRFGAQIFDPHEVRGELASRLPSCLQYLT